MNLFGSSLNLFFEDDTLFNVSRLDMIVVDT
jgi:hypothetical protein